MKNAKMWLGIFLIFASGVVIGGIGTGLCIRQRVEHAFESGPKGIRHMVIRRLRHELDLTHEQEEKVMPIISETQEKLRALRLKDQPQVEEIFSDALSRMKPFLTEEQYEKAMKLYERARARFG